MLKILADSMLIALGRAPILHCKTDLAADKRYGQDIYLGKRVRS